MATDPVQAGTLDVDGSRIAWWTAGTGPGTPWLLLHGGGAHAGWWRPMAAVVRGRPVVALDLSGHGRSGSRERYSYQGWAQELVAVAGEVCGGPVVVVAHSMHGRTGVAAAARHPDAVAGLVLLDTIIPTRSGEPDPRRPGGPVRQPTREDALRRFRLRPGTGLVDPAILSVLAEESVVQDAGGWTFAFDPRTFEAADLVSINGLVHRVRCPVAVVRGSLSAIATPPMAAEFSAALGRPVVRAEVPGTDHHMMLEDPEGTARVLGASVRALRIR
ncbi:alpha/beta fold hydrolase [Nakamurella alba]|uniref:alpha/beta fold hydrolase n=1 Tax=Nakamurella alba TaxID=2665158 RepID=UPI0018AA566A|nr:alpha/beta hydrolase [Nakamurella alba]